MSPLAVRRALAVFVLTSILACALSAVVLGLAYVLARWGLPGFLLGVCIGLPALAALISMTVPTGSDEPPEDIR